METIMVQENDEATMEVVTAALEMKGYQVRSLDGYNENAIERIRRYHPKLVLVDCWPGAHSGKQLSHWIKAHFRKLPIIAFSCDNQVEEHYRELGFDGYLKKPFDLEHLYGVIRQNRHFKKRHRIAAMV
ncbi:MAG: response regulator [Mucilaginibacter sp.]